MFRLQFVALDPLAAGLGVDPVQGQPVSAGDQTVSLVQVAAQFISVAGFARIVARRRNATAQFALWVIETCHIVTLPTVQADSDLCQPL